MQPPLRHLRRSSTEILKHGGRTGNSATTEEASLSSVGTEVENYFFHSLSKTRSILPFLQRLGSEIGEHRVATFDFNIGDIAVRKHASLRDYASLEVAFPEEFRILRFDAHNDLTSALSSPLGQCERRMKRQKKQCERQS